jgi:protein O-mannosyl-transferase
VALVALLAAALGLALYWPSLSFEFLNWDDWVYVVFNPHLGALDGAFVLWCFGAFYASNWHPLTLLSFGLDHALWDGQPAGYHLTNALLHAASSALVVWLAWELLRRVRGPTGGSLFGAAVVGLVFAAHPLHVESVAWISERKDVLYALFWLASPIAWLRYAEPDATPRERRTAYAAALGSFVLSALSKPMAVTLPLVLLLLDAYPLRRLARRGDVVRVALVEKLPFYAVSAATAGLTYAAQQASGAIGKAALSLSDRLWVAVRALGFYLAKWALPTGLVPLYPLEARIDPLRGPYLAALAAALALLGLALALRRRAPVVGASLAFYGVTLLPVLGLVELGYQSAADRYTYLPMLGPTFLVGAAASVAWDAGRRSRQIASGVAVVALGLLCWRTSDQLPVWRNSLSLWRRVVAAYPESSLAHYNLGQAQAMAGEPDRAVAEWQRTLEIDAGYISALYELGAAAGRNGEYRKARRYLEAALAADPGNARARLDLAQVLEALGEWPGASRHYREFLRTAPPSLAQQAEQVRSRLRAHGEDAAASLP